MSKPRIPGAGFGHPTRGSPRVANGVEFPLEEKPNGGGMRWVANPRGALATDPALGVGVRADPPLSIGTGSPYALQIDLDDTLRVQDEKLGASSIVARSDQLTAAESRISGLLLNEIASRVAADAALTASVASLKVMRECGVVTLAPGSPVTVTLANSIDLRDPTLTTITLTPYGTARGTRGIVRVDALANGSFDVASEDPTDESDVFWAVFA